MALIVDPQVASPRPMDQHPLVGWVMDRVVRWEQHRDQNAAKKWQEYYRLWRGEWAEEDKTRGSERSRLVAPALQQAVEAAVAEQEEATFGKGRWIDVSDDLDDQDRQDVGPLVTKLQDDLELAGVPAAISECYLNGAIYGTGIGKVVVDVLPQYRVSPSAELGSNLPMASQGQQVVVKLTAVDPREFVIDPAARTIDEGLGCAHITLVPLHTITEKQRQGVYRDVEVGDYSMGGMATRASATSRLGVTFDRVSGDELANTQGVGKLIEYHGKAPRGYVYYSEPPEDGGALDDEAGFGVDENDLVESIVSIANDGILLRAVENPFLMQDRSFVAYPHDKIPNRFWGRGICEKGYNPQKQLDAELRARIDALAFSVHPMLGVDASRLPRGTKLEVKPGRSILTQGDPREILFPIQFPPPDTQTYRQAGEMERMIQMGTGAMDSATPVGLSPRNNTASGMSMILAGALKRSKRTMQNIERYFLRPLIEKALWRYMSFAPERYPARDYKFVVRSTLGIMAREVEQQMLINLLSTVQQGSPAYFLLLKAVFENSSVAVKDEALVMIDAMLQQSMQPQSPPPDPNAEANAARVELEGRAHEQKMLLEVEKLKLEVRKLDQAEKKLMIEYMAAESEVELSDARRAQAAANALLAQTQAQSEQIGATLEAKKLELEAGMQDFIKAKETVGMIREMTLKAQVTESNNQDVRAVITKLAGDLDQLVKRPSVDVGGIRDDMQAFRSQLNAVVEKIRQSEPPQPETKPNVKIERDAQGKVVSVNGAAVDRDENGLIVGVGSE